MAFRRDRSARPVGAARPARAARVIRARARDAARAGSTLRRRRSVRITLRGWGTLGIGVLALVVGYLASNSAILVAAGAAILLVVIALAGVRLRRPRLEIERSFHPAVLAAGSPGTTQLRIRNTAPLASPPLRWNDAVPWPDSTPPHELAAIPTGSTRRRTRVLEYALTPPRRGVYPIGPFVLEYEDPFGMVTAVQAMGDADRLVVVPALVDLAAGGPVLADGDGAAQMVQRCVVGNDDDLTTREYRSGDAMRRVHWRASARRGQLMVRQEEHRSHPDARVLIDTREQGYADADPGGETWTDAAHSDAFEWAVRMTASLGVHLEASGFRVGFEETAPAQIAPIGEPWEGGGRTEEFLTSLAGIRLIDGGAGADVLAEPDGPLFAVLGDPEDATVEFALRRRRAGQNGTVYLVEARDSVAERFQQAGWEVVLVSPRSDPAAAWSAAAFAREPRAEARA